MCTKQILNHARLAVAATSVGGMLLGLLNWTGGTPTQSDEVGWQQMGKVNGAEVYVRLGRAGGEDVLEARITSAGRTLCQGSAPYRGSWELQPAIACMVQQAELKMFVFSAADPPRFLMFDGHKTLRQALLGKPSEGRWPIVVNWGKLTVAPQFRVQPSA